MSDLDLIETLPDTDVAMIGMLYFITAYLFPRDYKKVFDHFLFMLVEDFSAMNQFPWDEQLSAAKLEGPDCFSNPNIEICDLEPSETEMAMPYMNGVQYKKPIQPKFSPDSRRDKSRIEMSVDRAGMSGKSGPSVLLLTDSSVRQARVPDNDDDDFVDPPLIW
ncbi:Hypothetical predicted protein [Olea europaea subsp. europaea]|uniref:Uncharacterized protein n=1 Tax=Olea europaea subsp. europaea TaxID=158383 RepID=A0A8S0UTC3_OLEEU|nr:Hypothetical predicted protein [Olea europaea subsp. europaea]